ncbi:MAG: hypothetical protein JWM11_2253 [Planctomycetaceae bacterium]|nr:hypothetical protein [Planctomycetaceae bacterium]
MDLFSNASDDAIALAFCCGALLLSGGLMYFSRYLNPAAAKAAELAETPQLRIARPDYERHQVPAQEKAA